MESNQQKPSASQGIGQKVAEEISQATPSILTKVVQSLVNVEIDKRAAALLGAVNLAVATKREIYKCKADVVSYDEKGEIVSANWTKARLEERKKLEEKMAKIDLAVEKAVNGDFSKVLELKVE